MEKAYDRAAAVDRSDPYAVYDAAYELAKAYDKTVAALKASGIDLSKAKLTLTSASFAGSKKAHFTIVKGKTSFKVKVSKKKIKVTNLSKGSSRVRFSVKKVTNGQKSKVRINSKTGKLTLKKNIRKCTIYVKATSKANQNRKARTKTIKIIG